MFPRSLNTVRKLGLYPTRLRSPLLPLWFHPTPWTLGPLKYKCPVNRGARATDNNTGTYSFNSVSPTGRHLGSDRNPQIPRDRSRETFRSLRDTRPSVKEVGKSPPAVSGTDRRLGREGSPGERSRLKVLISYYEWTLGSFVVSPGSGRS